MATPEHDYDLLFGPNAVSGNLASVAEVFHLLRAGRSRSLTLRRSDKTVIAETFGALTPLIHAKATEQERKALAVPTLASNRAH